MRQINEDIRMDLIELWIDNSLVTRRIQEQVDLTTRIETPLREFIIVEIADSLQSSKDKDF